MKDNDRGTEETELHEEDEEIFLNERMRRKQIMKI